MARPGSKVLLKSLGYTSLVTLTGGSAFLLTLKTKEEKNASISPLRRTAKGDIIPPQFPKIKSREEQISSLRQSSSGSGSEIYDLLVIGGGATGTGIALDAATRGLKVALVERDDFSSGTSSKSTKLVHGGVRYLEKAVWNLDYGQYCLVKEALRERKSFLNSAPHLSSSLPILLPIQHWWQAPYFWAGTKAYDLLAGSQGLESSYFLSKKRAIEAFPMLKKNLVGALVYYDGQQNDSRMNISLALTAALYGATTVNHLEVTSLEKNADGQICGAKVRDLIPSRDGSSSPDSDFTVRARGVINATGPFADAIAQMDDPKQKELVSPSEGVHVVLPRHLGPPGNMGLLDASTSDGRVMFMLPWEGNIVAGTTDSACSVSASPAAKENDINFILNEVSKYLSPSVNLRRSDVLAAWSGIRPLMRDPHSANTESLVRNHLITTSPSGLLTCAGGKWTTYRQMAEDAVDAAISAFDLQPTSPRSPVDISGTFAAHDERRLDGSCQTSHLKVLGAHGYTPTLHIDLIRAYGLDADVAAHLARSYGDRAWSIASSSSSSSSSSGTTTSSSTNTRISRKYPITTSEIAHAVDSEYAATATDFLARRTRLAFLDADAALAALPAVIDGMGARLGWGEERVRREWEEGVYFLRGMGLGKERWGVGMEEVRWAGVDAPMATVGGGGKKPAAAQLGGVGDEVEGKPADVSVGVPVPVSA